MILRIEHPESAPNEGARQAFLKGAGLWLDGGAASGGLWFEETPMWDGKRVATVGGYTSTDRAAGRALLEEAAEIARARGVETLLGPMDGNTWRGHRLVTWSSGAAPFFLEPITPAAYVDDFLCAGFEVMATYSSARSRIPEAPRSLTKVRDRLARTGLVIRELQMANFEAELRQIHRLSLHAFAENFLYTPVAEDRFVHMYLQVEEAVVPAFVKLAEVNGELVGFVFALPDALNGGKQLILKTLAVKAAPVFAGLGTVLVEEVLAQARAAGMEHFIHALQHESNSSLRTGARYDPEVIRTYALYGKRLSPC